jgi:hypothetical protein
VVRQLAGGTLPTPLTKPLGGRCGCGKWSRFADLLIAATAHANGLDLYTRNGRDVT